MTLMTVEYSMLLAGITAFRGVNETSGSSMAQVRALSLMAVRLSSGRSRIGPGVSLAQFPYRPPIPTGPHHFLFFLASTLPSYRIIRVSSRLPGSLSSSSGSDY